MIAKHIIVKGKVQGVFFRRNAQQKANELNIKGWVKNTDNDNVEIIAQGDENNLQQFIEWCKEGPERAEVEDVEINDKKIDDSLKRFSIVY
jgi:acylphosphatase